MTLYFCFKFQQNCVNLIIHWEGGKFCIFIKYSSAWMGEAGLCRRLLGDGRIFFESSGRQRENLVSAVTSHHSHMKAANIHFLVCMFNYYAKIIYCLFRKPYYLFLHKMWCALHCILHYIIIVFCQIYLEPKSTFTLEGFTIGRVEAVFVFRPSTRVRNNIKNNNSNNILVKTWEIVTD